MSAENVAGDLNATIASAVQARVESEVVNALAGSELVTEMVSKCLYRKIEVKDGRDSYRTRETTVIADMIDQAMIAATRGAILKVVTAEAELIEAEVAKELRKNVKGIASTLAGQLQDAAKSTHGLSVELKYPGRY